MNLQLSNSYAASPAIINYISSNTAIIEYGVRININMRYAWYSAHGKLETLLQQLPKNCLVQWSHANEQNLNHSQITSASKHRSFPCLHKHQPYPCPTRITKLHLPQQEELLSTSPPFFLICLLWGSMKPANFAYEELLNYPSSFLEIQLSMTTSIF